MSNCMDVHPKSTLLVLSKYQIDLEGFAQLSSTAKAQDQDDERLLSRYELWDAAIAWWFLSDNVEVVEQEARIYLGEGRSTHTFRDFRATLHVISNYLKLPMILNFKVQDGEPGNEGWFIQTYKLSPGGGVEEMR